MIRIFVLAARDLWAESFLLMVFNLIWALTSLPGFALLAYGAVGRDLLSLGLGVAALALWPLSTFGLFHAAAQSAQRSPVHLRTMLDGARRAPGLAYRWGASGLAVSGLLAANLAFYLNPQAPLAGTGWASFLGAVFLLLLLLWLMGQVYLAAWIATQQAVSLRHAWRQLARQFVAHPLLSLAVGSVGLLLALLGILVIPAGLLLAFACVAVLACRAVIEWGGIIAPAIPEA
jgi:hypothetical protein